MLSPLWQAPGFKQIRQSPWLNERLRLGYGPHWGAFATRDEALAFLRPSQRAVADDEDMAQMNAEAFATVHSFDWPLIFFLSQAQKDGAMKSVTDLGGHLGAKYRAYRTQVQYSADLIWQVVDVPAVCRAGRRALRAGETQLAYFEALEDTTPCDTLICSGVLQYLDFSLAEAIDRLPAKPKLVLLNKVAVSEHAPFHTLESLGRGRIPYHVTTASELDTARTQLGYRQLARWDLPDRHVQIPSQRGPRSMTMLGEAWALNAEA